MKFETISDHIYCGTEDDGTKYIFRGEIYTDEESCLTTYNDFLALNAGIAMKIQAFLKVSTGAEVEVGICLVEFSSKGTEEVIVSFDIPVYGKYFSFSATMFGAECGKIEIEKD